MIEWRAILHNKYFAPSLAAFLALLLLSSVYYLVANMVEVSELAAPPPVPKLQRLISHTPEVAKLHLFGIYQGSLLPKTQLELSLKGIFLSNVAQDSQALIGAPGGKASLYNIKATLSGGATVYKILSDSVILMHNGKLETLPLVRPKLVFASLPKDSLSSNQ